MGPFEITEVLTAYRSQIPYDEFNYTSGGDYDFPMISYCGNCLKVLGIWEGLSYK